MSASQLLLGVLFGAIGYGCFRYGKQQHALVPLLCGLALMVMPYIIEAPWLLMAAGLSLVGAAYAARGGDWL